MNAYEICNSYKVVFHPPNNKNNQPGAPLCSLLGFEVFMDFLSKVFGGVQLEVIDSRSWS